MNCRSAVVALVVGVGMMAIGCQLWPDSSPDDEDEESQPQQDNDEQSVLVDWAEPLDVAEGDAFRGPWRMNESDFHYVDDPSVAIGDDGEIHVVWVDNQQQNAFYQRYNEDREPLLEEPTNVSESPGIFSWLPVVAPSRVDDDTVYVVWQEIEFRPGGSHGGEIFFSRSTDGGETFEESTNLSETIAGAGKGRLTAQRWNNGSLDMVVGPDDELYIAWTEYEGPLQFTRSEDGGETFDEPRQIGGADDTPARAPSLALAPDQRLYLAWAVGEDDTADLRFVISTDGGASFDEVETPVETPGHADAPEIAVDDEETVHLVFADSPDGRFQRYRVMHTFSTDRGAVFEAPTELSEFVDTADSANFPSLAVDGTMVFVIWEHYPDFQQRPVGLEFAASDDRGRSFTPASVVPETDDPDLGFNAGLQGLLMRKIDAADGELVIGHSHFRENDASRVRLYLGDYDPAPVASVDDE